DQSAEPAVKADDNTFKCITDMTPVRHFYVDNLLGNRSGQCRIDRVIERHALRSLKPARLFR
ncbi:MAG TPA: hypothetical protein VEH77_16140, partial [Roseiarcus sp.]|nr:hypothetical protein [Roseiarcus sp.]